MRFIPDRISRAASPTTLTRLGYDTSKHALFRFDPELMHDLSLQLLSKLSSAQSISQPVLTLLSPGDQARLRIDAFGRTWDGPLGLAAGFDKNAVAFPALLDLGFSFVEIGTVTPKAQPGNDKPRVWRLPEDQALINRMGFPGVGMAEVAGNLARLWRSGMNLGINAGPNKSTVETGDPAEDCLLVLDRLHSFASYAVINVSSPNTTGLRSLQGKEPLQAMVQTIQEGRNRTIPLLIKISPDLNRKELADVVEVALGCQVDGLIATNTTVSRPVEQSAAFAIEPGGLSGKPLQPLALRTIRQIRELSGGQIPVIGVGGIFSGADVIATLQAGASLVQCYTGFVYRGPTAPGAIATEMLALMDRLGVKQVSELIDSGSRTSV